MRNGLNLQLIILNNAKVFNKCERGDITAVKGILHLLLLLLV
jgi:hypothetical protein